MTKQATHPVTLMDGTYKCGEVPTAAIVGVLDRGEGESPRYILSTYSGAIFYCDQPPKLSDWKAAKKEFSIWNAEQLGLQLSEHGEPDDK